MAPPGYYMMFLFNSQGVPSVGKMIRLTVPTGAAPLRLRSSEVASHSLPPSYAITHAVSLRDFIVALDKSKADKLRYKVEDKFVKIFITIFNKIY